MRLPSSSTKSRPYGSGGGMARSGFSTFILFMISCLASLYVAGRLWQDSEKRLMLINMLEKSNGGGSKTVTVEEKLQILSCKDTERRLSETEMELMAARREGYMRKWMKAGNSTRLKAVIGINTEFGNRLRREAIRRKYMMAGNALMRLQAEMGIIVRFVIGRSANKGDSSDRRIDLENQETNDFLILDKHVEMSEEFANKAKYFFSIAVETWDADYYVKVDDDLSLNMDGLRKILENYSDKPRAYIGCMKSGDVIAEEGQRWYEKEWWKFGDGKSYFRHASGQFYILSRALAQYIHVNRDMLHTYAHEDISMGSWMLGLDAEHVDEKSTCCGKSKDSVCTSL